jgi:hypothetical protein
MKPTVVCIEESDIIRSCIIFTLHQVLLGWWNQG